MLTLTDVKTGRSTAISAVRAWRSLCAAKGAPFPKPGCMVLAAVASFTRAILGQETELAGTTLVSYLFAVRRFARLAFAEPDDPMHDRHTAVALAVARVQRVAQPRFDSRVPFRPSVIQSAVSDQYADLAVRAVCAVAWDGLCRLGSLIDEACPTGRRPLQARALSLGGSAAWPSFSLVIQDKMSPKGERVVLSADPGSAHHNPASCGAPFIVRRYMKWRATRPDGPLWLTRDSRPVTKAMVTRLMDLHRRGGPHITGHAFRISAASWLYGAQKASLDRIASLGRWHRVSTVVTYIRNTAPSILRTEDAGRDHA